MSFINPCMASLALVSGSIAVNLAIFSTSKSNQLFNTFDNEDQRQMYYIVKKERMQIHSIAYGISICAALLYAFALNRRRKNINYCFFSLIIHALAMIIYKCYPKQYNLRSYLVSQDQLKKYDDLKKQMKNSFVMGLAIGVGLYMFTESRCKKH